MAGQTIAQALAVISQERKKRDLEFEQLLKLGWRPSRLADHFKISRQRAYQIVTRLRKGKKKAAM